MNQTHGTLEVDLLVIGYGKGGKTLAAHFARLGRSVVMVEQSDQMYGGTCVNVGCVPTKALVHEAEHASRTPMTRAAGTPMRSAGSMP